MSSGKKFLPAALIAVSVLAVGYNVLLADREPPFGFADKGYQIEDVLKRTHWAASTALIFLDHFGQVEVTNVGDENVNGFGYSAKVSEIFKAGTIDATEDPIDLRGNPAGAKLLALSKDWTDTYCPGRNSPACRLDLIWDIPDGPTAKFVGVRFDKDAYGLVEESLLRRVMLGAE
ncbi:MAG: hypothetical protein ACKOWE_05485 [Micrococcales bacterium]